ncbi:MAG TPA: response regulator [Thermoanaerobaculia bacterium]|nr:response regulator [Thermoanaerobaculia bacterium]HUM30384.1 response regulator [Thermoanaerobaculia bacterium]HXK68605.1 response regulator [Thermoanaerobaculia bacterium]
MPRTLLIIDDEHDLLTFLKQVFSSEGFEVTTALDGETGITAAREIHPSLILLDIMLPGMDGWEILRVLRSDRETSDIPVVMLTARTDPESKWEGWQGGAVDYVTKPFTLTDIIQRVKEIVVQTESLRGER